MPVAARQALGELGELLSAARRERKLTQQDLAERVGVGRMTIHRMERGAPEVAIGWYLSAAWVLGLPILAHGDFAAARHDSAVALFLERLRAGLPDRVRHPTEDPMEPDDAF